jgi:thiol-disulfide isomerase/thioredoxin
MKIKRVLKLGAIWCQPCHVFGKTFEKVAEMEKYNGIEFKEVDIENDDDAELLVEKFGVRNVPTTLILDEEDNLIYKLIGNVSMNDFTDVLDKAINGTE